MLAWQNTTQRSDAGYAWIWYLVQKETRFLSIFGALFGTMTILGFN
jgi:hypothetical protein